MSHRKQLLDAWREQAVSRFAKALVSEMEAHGGPAAYGVLIGVKKPTMGTWVRNTSKPGQAAARRMAEVSPSLVPHLQERGCFDSSTPLARMGYAKGRHYQRKQAPVPLTASAQTTEQARAHHQRALSEAEQRALRLSRIDKIRKVASKVKDRQRHWYRNVPGSVTHAHYNPCPHGGQFAVTEGIALGSVNVGVRSNYEPEEI